MPQDPKTTSPSERGRRTPGFVNAVVGIAIVILVAALSITAAQAPPPAIAELSPSAVQQIKEAPSEQTSSAGEGDGGAGVGGLAAPPTTLPPVATEPGEAPPTTLPPTIVRARVRRCVGNPPRQTEDPQSPPCVPYWQGDNGGVTTRGVSSDEIRVVHGGGGGNSVPVLVDYFNKRFEFYGRRLKVTEVGSGDQTCPSQKAAAAAVAEEIDAFATIDSADGTKTCFHEELARRHIISATNVPYVSEAVMASRHPYMWSYTMAYDRGLAGIAAMVCARLKGANAVHSGDPVLATSPRKYGILFQDLEGEAPMDISALRAGLSACGITPEATVQYKGDASADQVALAQNAIVQMKSKQVSTVVCVCTIFVEEFISGAATNQAYFPEWILSTYWGNDFNVAYKLFWTQDQRKSIFGVASTPPMRSAKSEPALYAAQETLPASDPKTMDQLLNIYRSLLLLSSGIQIAGPNLTPETFGAGLQRTKFPYPQADPTKSGDVGFLDRDHTMTDDFVEFWWSETAKSPDMHASWSNGDPGALCYADGAARRRRGAWPTTADPFFTTACTADPGS
jgi:hypothetical protein